MRKLMESTFVTLDGVIENPQVWGRPYWDDEHGSYATALLARADALLLRARNLRRLRPAGPDGRGTTPTASTRCRSTSPRTRSPSNWNAELLEGDQAEAVAAVKERPGADLLKFGTGELDLTLIPAKLNDELHLCGSSRCSRAAARGCSTGSTRHTPARRDHPVRLGIVVNVYTPA